MISYLEYFKNQSLYIQIRFLLSKNCLELIPKFLEQILLFQEYYFPEKMFQVNEPNDWF